MGHNVTGHPMGHETSGAMQELGQQPDLRFPCPLAHEGTCSLTSKRLCFKKLGNEGETPNYLHLRYFSLASPPFLAHHTCTCGTLENIPEAHPCLGFWLPTTAGVPETKPQRTTERAQSAGSPPPSETLPGNRGPRTGPEQAWGKREKRTKSLGGVSRSAQVHLSLLPSHKARDLDPGTAWEQQLVTLQLVLGPGPLTWGPLPPRCNGPLLPGGGTGGWDWRSAAQT